MYRDFQGRSGPHSIHDARQHAWARLVLGPGAPAPNLRPHRGQLPDVHQPDAPRPLRRRMLARWLRAVAEALDPGSGASAGGGGMAGQTARTVL